MEEKLKSILKRISWSSVLKAAIFAAAWWFAPFWLFVIVALFLYYIPIAGAGTVSTPFLVLVILSYLETPGWFLALVLGGVFYCILLIKDLLIIDRRTAHELLMLVLTYLMLRGFFEHLGGGGFGGWSFALGAIVAGILAFLLEGFIGNFLPAPSEDPAVRPARYVRAVGWIAFMVIWQLIVAGLFLPLNFLYQGAIVFIVVAGFMDIISLYVFGEFSRNKILATTMVIFGFLVLVLASARWTL